MSVDILSQMDPALAKAMSQVFSTLRKGGFESYIAGGAVRNAILGLPVKEVDIATSAHPEDIEQLFEKTIPVGRQFGVMVVIENEAQFELTTFREETDYSDGRHPDKISFSDARNDVMRRDFTINGLFFDPISDHLLDFCEGAHDLKRGLIRTIGDPQQRFEEDSLRVLRAIRFASQFAFQIDDKTWQSLCEEAIGLNRISQERIKDELLKILTSKGAHRALRLMLETGILEIILPEVARMYGVEQPPQFHPEGDVFTHTCLLFELSTCPSPTLALGMLLHDVGKPPTFTIKDRIRFDRHAEVGAELSSAICKRLRISKKDTESVIELVKQHLRFINVMEMRDSTLKRFLRQPNFQEHLELHRLDCLASHGDLSAYEFCAEKLHDFGPEDVRPDPLINGHDLIDLGLTPGPQFSDILTRVEDLHLENTLSSKEDAMAWVQDYLLRKKI